MRIRSLLFGSAAALVAVSGAKAADAVQMIAEPEPMEYVRVCDTYGTGWFYIPGTETCLKFSGYVWYQIGATGYEDRATPFDGGDTTGYIGGATAADGWIKSTRVRLNVDAREETEWGTLRAFIRFQADWGNGANGAVDGPVAIDQGYLQLGGLLMGYTESAWTATANGGASNFGSHSWGGMYYGYQQRHQIAYNFSGGNGFYGTISLEDDNVTGAAPGYLSFDNNEGYMPDVVVKVGVNQGWGGAFLKVAYDESFDGSIPASDASIFGFNSGGWAVGAGLILNVPNSPGSSLRLLGSWADGSHAYNYGGPSVVFQNGFSFYGGSEWTVIASYNHQFSAELGVSAAFQWFNDLYYRGSDVSSGVDAWAAELSVVWVPIPNFETRLELHYDDVGSFKFPATPVGTDPSGTWSGFLRFTRYF